MLRDADGREHLDAEKLKAGWRAEVTRIADRLAFTPDQHSQAQKILDENLQWAEYWFDDPENAEKRKKYEHDLRHLEATQRDPQALSYQSEQLPQFRGFQSLHPD